VKVEKQVAGAVKESTGELGPHDVKAPRPIMQHSDAVLVLCNPILNELKKRRKEKQLEYGSLDPEEVKGEHLPVSGVMPLGLSGEAVGEWFRRAIHEVGEDCVVIEADGATWDGHMRGAAMKAASELSVGPAKITPPAARQYLMRKTGMVASSALGVKVKTRERQLATGAPETGDFNGWTNLSISCYILDTGCLTNDPLLVNGKTALGRDYFVAVAGDDNALIVRRSHYNACMAKVWEQDIGSRQLVEVAWRAAGKRLGFELTLKVTTAVDFEFCSRFFYPVRIKGVPTLLPGAKIGRTLAKIGFIVDKKNGEVLRSGLMSSLHDNYHVPFVREACQTMLKLVSNKNGTPPKEEDYMMHTERKHEYCDETWAFVTHKYGLGKADLKDFEQLLRTVKKLPAAITWKKMAETLSVE